MNGIPNPNLVDISGTAQQVAGLTGAYPQSYAGGGIASSAQNVESKGRGEDTMLVHMTPKEVRGLQAIAMAHGGSLTINPETGLVEAGFLSNILPMVAGAALMATGVGAPMAAMLVGGGTALMSGSLQKGLMAGLGAFGGASLGSALSAAGSVGATTTPLATGTAEALAGAGASAAPTGLQAALPSMGVETAASMAPASLAPAGSTAALQTAAAGAPQGLAANMSQMGTGLSNVIQGTPGARDAFMQASGGPTGLIKNVASAGAPAIYDAATQPVKKGKQPEESPTYIRPYAFDYQKSSDVDPEFRYRTGAPGEETSELRYFDPKFTAMGSFKPGTEPGGSFYGTPTEEDYARYAAPKRLATGGIAGLGKGGLRDGAFVVPADVVSHLGNGSNDAGQKILARGLGARPIKGKGDGMSDSIPTSIEGKQPARVADGEAYVPPEVVKKVGAKRLYNMMAKIRKARTGTNKQAPEVNASEFVPA